MAGSEDDGAGVRLSGGRAGALSPARPRIASARGPSRDGPENVPLSRIFRMSSVSIAAMNLKILGMALARAPEAGASIPYIRQKFLTSPKAGRKDLSSNLLASSATNGRFAGETSIFATYSGAATLTFLFPGLAAEPLPEDALRRPDRAECSKR